MWLLGIDVGTGGTRAVIVDEAGKVVASASSEHAAFRSPKPGWAEQDPEDWWRATQEAVSAALAAARKDTNSTASVDAIGLTGQMHGAVMLDEDGKVLRPALIWCDQRTDAQCDWLHEQLGREHLIELTCNPALPNFTLTKLLWVKEHEPEVFARIRHMLCPKDYVRYRMTGKFAMDVQEASGTLLLDVTHRTWSATVAKVSGIPESWLPELFESSEVCAEVSAGVAEKLGLKGGHSGGGRRWRPGRWSGWNGHPDAGIGVGDHRNLRRGIRSHRQPCARSQGPFAHVLPCCAGKMARDGCDAICGVVVPLVPGDICGGILV